MRDFKPPFAASCRCRSRAFGLAGCLGRQPTAPCLACCIGDRYTALHKHHQQRKRMEESKYANMTVKKIQGLLRAKGAKLDGRKHDLITRWDKTPGKIWVGDNGVWIWAGPPQSGNTCWPLAMMIGIKCIHFPLFFKRFYAWFIFILAWLIMTSDYDCVQYAKANEFRSKYLTCSSNQHCSRSPSK